MENKTKLPKTIVGHPSVESVTSGWDASSDYKYWVELKAGYTFTEGAKAGGGSGGFNTVKRFLDAEPKQESHSDTTQEKENVVCHNCGDVCDSDHEGEWLGNDLFMCDDCLQ